MKGFNKIFFEKWKSGWLWVHYVLLTAWLFFVHSFRTTEAFEKKVVIGEPNAWIALFLWYAFWIMLGDQVIHYVLERLLGWEG